MGRFPLVCDEPGDKAADSVYQKDYGVEENGCNLDNSGTEQADAFIEYDGQEFGGDFAEYQYYECE